VELWDRFRKLTLLLPCFVNAAHRGFSVFSISLDSECFFVRLDRKTLVLTARIGKHLGSSCKWLLTCR
jgi:hypothetical protein